VTLILCWLAFPLVLALLSAGLGLLVERAAALRMETSLLLPCGFALLVVVTSLATASGASARFATPTVLVLAGLGFVLGARRRGWAGASGPGTAAVLGAMAAAAAPVVLTGDASFAGYTQLDDISTFLALASHAIEHGRDVSGLPPSTYEAAVAVNMNAGYPLGSFVPLAAARPIVGQELAWLWQPYLTYTLGMLALCLWALARPVVREPRLRALAVFVAAQPALLYAYALQGAVKELPAAALAALAAAVSARLLREPDRARLAIPLGVAGAALLCVLNVGAGAYIGPLAVGIGIAGAVWRPRAPAALRRLGEAGALTALVVFLLAFPVLIVTSSFLTAGGSLLENTTDIGNLFHPLDWKQLFGIWPSGDFRNGIGQGEGVALVLIALLGAAAVLGALWTVRRRAFGPALFATATVGALVGLSTLGSSPWVEAKALAIASPAVVLLGALAGCVLVESRRRVLGAAALAAIAAGVLWSNWLAYRDVKLAPRDRLAELATIGERFAGQGPAMIDEYEPYGARYFLRRMDPEAPAELRRRLVPLRNGGTLGKNQWAPLDRFEPGGLADYRTIVVRRSPAESRPPAQYALRWSGSYYDVWQRPARPRSRLVADAAFGDDLSAAARPPCSEVRRLARLAARRHATLVAAVRAPAVVANLASASRPPWPADPGPLTTLHPTRPGTVWVDLTVPAAGVHDAWLRGSFGRGMEVSIDGRRVGSVRDERSFAGQWIRLGARDLTAGSHRVALRYPGGGLRPGSGQQPQDVGPLALVPRAPRTELIHVAPARARELCARPLDWLEVVAPA
jgi:hypothetical protein